MAKPVSELSFLDAMNASVEEHYRRARWRLSPFAGQTWQCRLAGVSFTIDFSLKLSNGTLLSSAKNEELCNAFKYFLCSQDALENCKGRLLDDHPLRNRLGRALSVLDWLLLNEQSLGLAEFGLASISEWQLSKLFRDLTSTGSVATAVYRWPHSCSAFFRNLAASVNDDDIDAAQFAQPHLTHIDPSLDRVTDLSDDELIRARIAASRLGYLRRGADHKYVLDNSCVIGAHYSNTFRGRSRYTFPTLPEFLLGAVDRYQREYEAAPVRNDSRHFKSKTGDLYKPVLRSLGALSAAGIIISPALAALPSMNLSLIGQDAAPDGRYQTLPFGVVLDTIRGAAEFVLTFGDLLVDGYLETAKECINAGLQHPPREWRPTGPVGRLLVDRGVDCWHLAGRYARGRRKPSADYFSDFRSNRGFYELMRVLFGAAVLLIGSLTGRRQAELIRLRPGTALSIDGACLTFELGKSGVMGNRRTESRPVINLIATVIRLLERLHAGLKELGAITSDRLLLAPPKKTLGLARLEPHVMNRCLDALCDYLETQRDAKGRRRYIREHQLRRFLAQSFLFGDAEGGFDTIRWMLGQTDPEHLWHYITESLPGATLVSAKAAFASERFARGDEELQSLASLINERYGVGHVRLASEDQIEGYLEALIEEGAVTVEPIFFESAGSKAYKVIVRVIGAATDVF